MAGAPYKTKKIKQKRQNRRQSVVAVRQQFYCAVQSRSPNHYQTPWLVWLICSSILKFQVHLPGIRNVDCVMLNF